jgi:excisionase family DNA binding protein
MISVNSTNTSSKSEVETPCLAMRAREAALALGISDRLLWEWTSRGQVPHIRMGKVILYPVDTLRTWLQQQAQKKTDANLET